MLGTLLFLVVGAGVGGSALGLWLFFRRVRSGIAVGSQPDDARLETPPPAAARTGNLAGASTSDRPLERVQVPASLANEESYERAEAPTAWEPAAQDTAVDDTNVLSSQAHTERVMRSGLNSTAASPATADDPAAEIAAPLADPPPIVREVIFRGPHESSCRSEVEADDAATPLADAHLTAAYRLNTTLVSAIELEPAPAVEVPTTDAAPMLAAARELPLPEVQDDAHVEAVQRRLEEPVAAVADADGRAEDTADQLYGDVGPWPDPPQAAVRDEPAPAAELPAMDHVAARAVARELPLPEERDDAHEEAVQRRLEEPVAAVADADGRAEDTADQLYGDTGPQPDAPQSAVDVEPVPAAELPATDPVTVLPIERKVPPAEEVEDARGESTQPLLEKPVARAADAEAIADELYWYAGPQPDSPQPAAEGAVDELAVPDKHRPSKAAKHRDRRGQRRASPTKPAAALRKTTSAAATPPRTPAEARLRLILHPVRRSASLSAVLARPPGYPDLVTVRQEAGTEVRAYDEDRYDDVDLEWTPSLLTGELRLDCEQGYQWLRSSRRVHIFRAEADEPNLISVGFAALKSPCAIVCRREDADAVRSAARMCGSPELTSHDRWTGVPDGWAVLSDYLPTHAASEDLEADLTALDPGVGAEIRLSSGLQISAVSFAEGSPPRIEITPFPAGARVTIDGAAAEMGEDGTWRASGWDTPGHHLIDVVPGPSATYRILADPWSSGGWESWDAHPGRFAASDEVPWSRVQICGASLFGPSGEHVVAAEPMATLIVLGQLRGVAALRPRSDTPIAVGLLREPPAFLILASGPRRTQGRIAWLAPSTAGVPTRSIDPRWVAAVRSVALRRLPLDDESVAGQGAWRRARDRARRHVKEDT